MRISLFLILTGIMLLGAPTLQASEPTVTLSTVNLEGRIWPGFRLSINQSPEIIRQAILDHLTSFGVTPQLTDNPILCELALYPPVSSISPTSLVYFCHSISEEASQLEIVAFYDGKRALQPRDFPELSLRLLLDLEKLVWDISKEKIQYAHLFEEEENPEMQPEPLFVSRGDREKGKTQEGYEALLSAYRDTIRILKDGVYGYGILMAEQQAFIDTLLGSIDRKSLDPVVRRSGKISNHRLIRLQDSVNSLRELDQLNHMKLVRQKRTIDSLRTYLGSLAEKEIPEPVVDLPFIESKREDSLTEEIEDLMAERAHLMDSIAHIQVKSREQKQTEKEGLVQMKGASDMAAVVYQREMRALQGKYQALYKINDQLQKALKSQQEANDFLSQRLMGKQKDLNKSEARSFGIETEAKQYGRRLRSKMKHLDGQLQEAELQAELTQRQNKSLTAELKASRQISSQRLRELEQAQVELLRRQQKVVAAQLELTHRTFDVRDLSVEIDSLSRKNERQRQALKQKSRKEDSLIAQIQLLDPYSESAKARRRVYQEQLDNLTLLQKRLPPIEKQLYAKEKLIKQREKYLILYEETGELDGLLKRISELEKENQILLEQNAKDIIERKPVIFGRLYSGMIQRDNKEVLAFCFDSEEAALGLQDRVEVYFREKNLLPSSEKPLTYKRVRLEGPEALRINMTFEFGEAVSNGQRRVSCTAKLVNGSYIRPDDSAYRNKIQHILEEIFKP